MSGSVSLEQHVRIRRLVVWSIRAILSILEQGVDVWNKWREACPDIQPNLAEAHLGGTNLHGVNFSNTILYAIILCNHCCMLPKKMLMLFLEISASIPGYFPSTDTVTRVRYSNLWTKLLLIPPNRWHRKWKRGELACIFIQSTKHADPSV